MSGRWALSLSLSLSLCVLFLAGCVDTHTSPELPASDEGPTSSDPFFAIESAPVTLSTTRAPVLTYFCSTSRRTSGLDASGNARYEYGLLRFRYSEREYAVEAGGEEVDFIVHVNDDAGEIEWAAWCHIPHSPASVERVLDRLGLAAHVSTEQVLSRPSPKRRAEGSGDFGDTSGAGMRPMWHEGDDDEEDGRCGAGQAWDPELGGCVTPIELPPIEVVVPPSDPPPPPPEDPDPWPWPDPDPEDPPGGGGGDDGGGGTPPPPPPPGDDCEAGQECEDQCHPDHDPDCEQKLTQADLDDLENSLNAYLRSTHTDPDARSACAAMAGEFEKRLWRGQVTKGAFTTGPDDPHETIEHAGYYNDKNGVIHIEPFVFDSVRVDNPVTKRRFMQALVMVSLHESAHALGYEHPSTGYQSQWGAMYDDYPFNHLQPGPNSCVDYSS